jgi:putative SOS response-associated peptidase YedK
MATFNARAETVETKPFFRDAFKRTRCLIPVSGYCEWQDTPTGKQPWYFTARDGSPTLTTAGLWDEWRDRASGEALKSCTMIITEPKAFVAEVHDHIFVGGAFEPRTVGAMIIRSAVWIVIAASSCRALRCSQRGTSSPA